MFAFRRSIVPNAIRRSRAFASNKEPLLLISEENNVITICMNTPERLNGWTQPMMFAIKDAFASAASDPDCKALILTGADPYYCAGVNLSDTMKPMHPKTLFDTIVSQNQALFDTFLDFPKPVVAAVNGPAIGACVTSATLCDAIIASEKATFHTPFAALGIVPEGCSSVHFERIMGPENARKMLDDGWKPTAEEAEKAGFVAKVVPHATLREEAQAKAEALVAAGVEGGVDRTICGQPATSELVQELKNVNARESVALAKAFMSVPFLTGQYEFLKSRNKSSGARVFWWLRALRPLWYPLSGAEKR